jgi:hypothetical protein
LIQVDVADESKRAEGYYLTDVEFSTEDPELPWEAIDQRGLKMFPAKSIQELAGKRSFVGHFPKAQILLGTREAGYESVERSGAKLVLGNVLKFGQTIDISIGTNFGTAGIFNMIGTSKIRRTRYDNTPKQVPAFIGDQLRNRRNRPHILYDVEKKTAWMVPEACIILYLMHRWASLQEPPPVTDNQQPLQDVGRYQSSGSQSEIPLGRRRQSVLAYMPFIEASCDGGKKAADDIRSKCSESLELPRHVRSAEDPEKPVYVANIVVKMYLTIDALIEHQKRQKPGFFSRLGNRPYIWGYELADVAELNEAPAKGVRINKARSGGWYALTERTSEMAILFGQNLGNLIRYELGQTICHCWTSVPMGYNFLSVDSEALKYLQTALAQKRVSNFFLSNKHSQSHGRESQQCEGKAWPCCDLALQLQPMPPKLILEVKQGEAVVIGKAVTKLKKATKKGFKLLERRRSIGLVESQGASGFFSETRNPNGPGGQVPHREAEPDAHTELEESDSSDDAEYLSCEE